MGGERGASASNRPKLFLSRALALKATVAPRLTWMEHWRNIERNLYIIPPGRPKQQHSNLSLLGHYVCFSGDEGYLPNNEQER
jgi:hypothetical protein